MMPAFNVARHEYCRWGKCNIAVRHAENEKDGGSFSDTGERNGKDAGRGIKNSADTRSLDHACVHALNA